MKLTRRQAAIGVAVTTLLPSAWSQPANVPIEHFFRRPQLSSAELNPSGTHVALLVGGDSGRRRLVVLDLSTMKTEPVGALQGADVAFFHWVNDKRLLFAGYDEKGEEGWRGYFAVDVDGGAFKRLSSGGHLLDQGPKTGDAVLITRPSDSSEGAGFFRLWRLDTRSGHETELEVPPWSQAFLIDGQGQPSMAVTARGDKAQLRLREGKSWRVLREFDRFFGSALTIHGLAEDGSCYVTTRRGHDQEALYRYDPKADALSEKPLLALATFDLSPTLIQRDGKLLGVRVQADAVATVWFDEECKALQGQLDAKLKSTANIVSLPSRGASPWALVWAYSDRQPAQAAIYHRETEKLTLLGRSRPHIDAAQMSAQDYTPYKARDGRVIPAYLTLPRSAGKARPLPLVVMVHGGPFARGATWGWNDEVQFLASRGYAVIQPEFRGSVGFGESHFKAGWRQWGQAMQDDVADAAQWAVAEGIADPKRIAILGGSYGGYAAMMGLVRHPELFACAVNLYGVTDLDLLFGATWSDVPGVFKAHGLPKILGDRKADADMLKRFSPLHQAERIQKPVLMAYGRLDQRVPIEHGERMRAALNGHNANVEWVLYDKEGHGWYRTETEVDFWGRVERFLRKHMPPV